METKIEKIKRYSSNVEVWVSENNENYSINIDTDGIDTDEQICYAINKMKERFGNIEINENINQ